MHYIFLSIAIIMEVVATISLKFSKGFTVITPSVLVVLGYGSAFYFLGLALKSIPVGTAYAIWAGLGIVLTFIVDAIISKRIPDVYGVAGVVFIVLGVVFLKFLSGTVASIEG